MEFYISGDNYTSALNYGFLNSYHFQGDRSGRDPVVVGLITTYAISAYHHYRCEFATRLASCAKFVSDLRQVGRGGSPVNDRYDITEILLKVALNIITITLFKVLAIIQFEFLTMSYDQLSTLL